jgi:DNA-binding MarR family transcriptional regulator
MQRLPHYEVAWQIGYAVGMAESTGELLMTTARRLRRRFGEALSDWEITPAQGRALRIVCDHEPVRLSVLAEHLRIAARSATEVVDALEDAGLVQRTPDPLDRRAVCVGATAAGHERKAVIDGVRRTATEDFLAPLSDRDRATLDRILRLLGED